MPSARDSDRRGTSEALGLGILVSMTLLVTVSVGVGVLFVDQNPGEPRANFTFDYFDDASTLVVTHRTGDEIPAGALYVESREQNASWARIAGENETYPVGVGDAVQLSRQSEWGDSVRSRNRIRIVYVGGTNVTVLERWDG